MVTSKDIEKLFDQLVNYDSISIDTNSRYFVMLGVDGYIIWDREINKRKFISTNRTETIKKLCRLEHILYEGE